MIKIIYTAMNYNTKLVNTGLGGRSCQVYYAGMQRKRIKNLSVRKRIRLMEKYLTIFTRQKLTAFEMEINECSTHISNYCSRK